MYRRNQEYDDAYLPKLEEPQRQAQIYFFPNMVCLRIKNKQYYTFFSIQFGVAINIIKETKIEN